MESPKESTIEKGEVKEIFSAPKNPYTRSLIDAIKPQQREIREISEEKKKLLEITKQSLYLGIDQAVSGNRTGDIGHTVQSFVEKEGYSVVRELVGHGVGKNLHEEPEVPNYGKKGSGVRLQERMVIAIEPMVNIGSKNIFQERDGWTIRTVDRKPSAHFEHTVVVMKGKAEILTTFKYIEEVLGI